MQIILNNTKYHPSAKTTAITHFYELTKCNGTGNMDGYFPTLYSLCTKMKFAVKSKVRNNAVLLTLELCYEGNLFWISQIVFYPSLQAFVIEHFVWESLKRTTLLKFEEYYIQENKLRKTINIQNYYRVCLTCLVLRREICRWACYRGKIVIIIM